MRDVWADTESLCMSLCGNITGSLSACHVLEPYIIKSPLWGVSLSKKEMAQMIFKFAFYHTITSLYIWIWPVNGILYVGFSWHSSGRVWKGWSKADLMLGSSRLAGFGPLRTQGTMTTSLCERSHSGHVTQSGYCMTESTPPQENKGHFHSLVIYCMMCHRGGIFIALGFEVSILTVIDILGYLDGSGLKWLSFDVHQRFHETCLL